MFVALLLYYVQTTKRRLTMDPKESALLLISQLSKVETEAVYLVGKLSDHGDKAKAIARAIGASEGEITEAIDRGVDEARRVGE